MITTQEAAQKIGISPETVRYYAWRYHYGKKIGNTRIFSPQDIAEIMRRREERKEGK